MSKKIRNFIFFSFIILFVVGTIIISLYASGYKFNLSWPLRFNRVLIKTGMIAVDSEPDGAIIYLNNEPQKYFSLNPWKKDYLETAAKIKNIIPGDYSITLKKDGYWPASKRVSVFSNQTTFAEDIKLFPSDSPMLVSSSSESLLSISPDYSYIYSQDNATLFSTEKNEEINIENTTDKIAHWLKNSQDILVGGRLYQSNGLLKNDYLKLIGETTSNWKIDENSDRLYFKNGNSLGYLQLRSSASGVLIKNREIIDYETSGDSVFVVSKDNGRQKIEHYDKNGQLLDDNYELPSIGDYHFCAGNENRLCLYDERNQTLFLFPDNLANNRKDLRNIKSWQWLDNDNLLYSNGPEIYQLDLENNHNELVARYGESINDLIWYKKKDCLIFSTAGSINVFDLKAGLTTKLASAEKIYSPVIDEKNATLYFWASVSGQDGIYKLGL